MRVLISGANGYVGSQLLAKFVDDGIDVAALHRSPWPNALKSLSSLNQVTLLQADLSKSFEIAPSMDAIIHTAALSRPNLGNDKDYAMANVEGTQNLVNAAIQSGAQCIFNLSSISVYGTISSTIIDETTTPINPDTYGQSKLSAERSLKAAADQIPSLSVRLPGILGKDAEDPWIARIAKKASQGDPIEIFNAQHLFNACIHIDDLYRAAKNYVLADNHDAEIVTLASRNPVTVAETVRFIVSNLQSSSAVIARSKNRPHYVISTERAERILNFTLMSVTECLESYISNLSTDFRTVSN